MFLASVLLCLLRLSESWLVLEEFQDNKPVHQEFNRRFNQNKPLILSNYLNNNDYITAKEKAQVKPIIGNLKSYSGYITVDPVEKSNMFFWYFPSLIEDENAPVMIWLQGGPGGSSLYGLFLENGPYYIDRNGDIHERNYTWIRTMHMIYIDNPIGTGYSFTDSKNNYNSDQSTIGRNLYLFLVQFYQIFSETIKNPLFIASESYGGKFATSLAHKIHSINPNTYFKINLQGLIYVSAFIDPINQINYGDFLQGIGLIDRNENRIFQLLQNQTRESILSNNYDEAFTRFQNILGGKESIYNKFTGYNYLYNYLYSHKPPLTNRIDEYLQKENVKMNLHVGNTAFKSIYNTADVYYKLKNDFTKSVSKQLIDLANNYDLLFINGQLDVITAYQLTSNVISKLNWCDKDELSKSERVKLYVGLDLVGYMKTTMSDYACLGSISEIMMRNAGHLVPADQTKFTYHIINNYIQSVIA